MEGKKFWAVIPAAGVGKRMHSNIPKQYMNLGENLVIERTLITLLDHYGIAGAVVAISKDDQYWQELAFSHHKPFFVVDGGEERSDSVLNALNRLLEIADEDDWALVHDAARPNVCPADVMSLILEGCKEPDGALLGYRVKDTMKKTDELGKVITTVSRDNLWHALTPQMFPIKILRDVIVQANEQGVTITDDASAMELAGYRPKFIDGKATNIKITTPEDLELIKKYNLQGDDQCE